MWRKRIIHSLAGVQMLLRKVMEVSCFSVLGEPSNEYKEFPSLKKFSYEMAILEIFLKIIIILSRQIGENLYYFMSFLYQAARMSQLSKYLESKFPGNVKPLYQEPPFS